MKWQYLTCARFFCFSSFFLSSNKIIQHLIRIPFTTPISIQTVQSLSMESIYRNEFRIKLVLLNRFWIRFFLLIPQTFFDNIVKNSFLVQTQQRTDYNIFLCFRYRTPDKNLKRKIVSFLVFNVKYILRHHLILLPFFKT